MFPLKSQTEIKRSNNDESQFFYMTNLRLQQSIQSSRRKILVELVKIRMMHNKFVGPDWSNY